MIKQGDCLELMKKIPAGSVDAIICDLPYGTTDCSFDVRIPFEPMWEEFLRVTKLNAAVGIESTAGTHRVCGRCLELKDKTIGTTAETGVILPPLHPRCRCAIIYREVGFNFDIQRFGGQRLPEGEYNLTVRRQVQARHIEGTKEYADYVTRLSEKNLMPSKLAPDIDIQSLIREFHGKGTYDPNPKDNSPREKVDTGKIIGQYWNKDKNLYVETTRLEIVYSKRGTHICPIRPKEK